MDKLEKDLDRYAGDFEDEPAIFCENPDDAKLLPSIYIDNQPMKR